MIRIFLFVFLFNSVGLARPMDPDGKNFFFGELDLRYLKKQSDLRWITEIKVRNSFDSRIYSHFKLGANYRLSTHFKVGLFYRGQNNRRNIDDWNNVSGTWKWTEPSKGFESVISQQLIGRVMLSSQLRGELRVQNDSNISNGFHTLRLRPNFTYFVFDSGRHLMNLYLQYESFLPLNYANNTVQQRWVYLGTLFPIQGGHQWGVNVSFAEWIWTPSENFKSMRPSDTYKLSDKAYLVGLTYLFGH